MPPLSSSAVLSAPVTHEILSSMIDECVAAQTSVLQVSPSDVAFKLDCKFPNIPDADFDRIMQEIDAELFFRRIQFYSNR